ncbi:NTP transferase domain-containing protein [Candidatus Sumerlaeota bacterium]|nr:NTP transferase domain-containing protein [Candidatus Sumerlaeota bacterium]
MIKEKSICAMIMAGGQGSRLSILSELRAKPAVPFAGKYRIIDFTISNAMHSRIPYVGICTQYRPYSLMTHISNGSAWGYGGQRSQLSILPPYHTTHDTQWYKGTADAIYQNLEFIEHFQNVEYVLILSGDHIYHMDYRKLLEFHSANQSDLTIVTQEIPWEETCRFGIVVLDGEQRITGFQEKPKQNPASNLANLGIYLFNRRVLEQRLREDAEKSDEESEHDFGKNVIPSMVEHGDSVQAFRFNGFWRDVGTIQSYWETSMELLSPDTDIRIEDWRTRTNPWSHGKSIHVPARVLPSGTASHALISQGCMVEGKVRNSVLSPGVYIGQNAVVEDSVILNDVYIAPGAVVRKAIIDKHARVGYNTVIGEGDNAVNVELPGILDSGITVIGKQAELPPSIAVGKNCLVYPGVSHNDFRQKEYESGSTIRK